MVNQDEQEAERKFYDRVYNKHQVDGGPCGVAVIDLDKARQRVRKAFAAFGLNDLPPGFRILDVGCGLGFTSEALRLEGARVTAIDLSTVAIESAKATFPDVDFRCVAFPDGVNEQDFDLVWAQDLTLLNTNDMDAIHAGFVRPALELLRTGGQLVIVWHTKFTGPAPNWVHWTMDKIKELKNKTGFVGPRVVEAPFLWMSWMIVQTYRILRKSARVHFILRKY